MLSSLKFKCRKSRAPRKMAAPFLSTANTLFSKPSSTPFYPTKLQSFRSRITLCGAISGPPSISKRGLALCFISSFVFSSSTDNANAAILEADDDLELLEKVKTDRKRRLERQGIINSSTKEKGYLQEVVYKLSELGQDIEKSDLSAVGSVLGGNPDWVKKANVAFNKLSSSEEEQTEVDTFNSSLGLLVSSVTKNDVESSKVAFVSSAAAFERWTALTGLVGVLQGL